MKQHVNQSPWLHGRFIDLMTGCGGWSLPLILIATTIGARYRIELGAIFYFLAVFCNNPHYMATLYRAYGGKKEFNRYRVFSLYLTTLIVIAGLVAHSFPALIPWLLTVYLIWSPWHYTGQNFGISMLMTRRAGVAPAQSARNLIYFSYCASYLVWLLDLLSAAPAGAISITFEIAPLLSLSLRTIGYVAFVSASILGFALLWKNVERKSQLVAPLLLHLSQFLWFLLPGITNLGASRENPSTYFSAGVLAFMHCAQYLWITSYFAKKEAAAKQAETGSGWSPWRYFLILTLGGIALFTPGPWLVSTLFGQDLFQSALVFTALVNIHHFMLDGAIWKLRDGRIARLLFGSAHGSHAHAEENEIDSRPNLLAWFLSRQKSARAIRWSLAAGLVFVAGADQLQNVLTLKNTTPEKIAIAQSLNPNDSRVSLRLAQLQAAEGGFSRAIETLEAERERNPRNLAILHLLAQLQFQEGQLDLAKRRYAEILSITPTDLSALTNSGLIAMRNENWMQAAEHFETADREEPGRWQTNLLLATSLYRLGNYSEAIAPFEVYLHLIEVAPEASTMKEALEASSFLAECYEKTGEHQEANRLRLAVETLTANP